MTCSSTGIASAGGGPPPPPAPPPPRAAPGVRIGGVGPKAAGRKRVDEIIDCAGKLVIPGLIQPHVHLCQTLFRGSADDLELLDWLRERIWPFEGAHTYQSLYTSTMVGAAELLRTGTTAILDMGTVHHTDAVFAACERIGIRATVGKAMMDDPGGLPESLQETTEASIDESLRLAAKWHGAANGRLRYAFAPRFVLCCTESLMVQVVKLAKKHDLQIHTHASENANEIDAVRALCGMDNVDYLHSIGVRGSNTVLAHCVHVTDGEIKKMARAGTHVAHCPSSNLKLASGVARVPELLRRGVNVAIGADGAPCNNNLDAFVEMRLAGLIQKPVHGPTAMPAQTVFEMATVRGAQAMGLADQIGSLEVGKKADVVVVDPGGWHTTPSVAPYSQLVYAHHGADVTDVFVDGIQCVRRGRVLGASRSLRKKACDFAAALTSAARPRG